MGFTLQKAKNHLSWVFFISVFLHSADTTTITPCADTRARAELGKKWYVPFEVCDVNEAWPCSLRTLNATYPRGQCGCTGGPCKLELFRNVEFPVYNCEIITPYYQKKCRICAFVIDEMEPRSVGEYSICKRVSSECTSCDEHNRHSITLNAWYIGNDGKPCGLTYERGSEEHVDNCSIGATTQLPTKQSDKFTTAYESTSDLTTEGTTYAGTTSTSYTKIAAQARQWDKGKLPEFIVGACSLPVILCMMAVGCWYKRRRNPAVERKPWPINTHQDMEDEGNQPCMAE